MGLLRIFQFNFVIFSEVTSILITLDLFLISSCREEANGETFNVGSDNETAEYSRYFAACGNCERIYYIIVYIFLTVKLRSDIEVSLRIIGEKQIEVIEDIQVVFLVGGVSDNSV